MKLEIEFNGVTELKLQLSQLLESLSGGVVTQPSAQLSLAPVDPVVKQEDIEEVETQPEPEEAPAPKAKRKTKADRQKELAKPKAEEVQAEPEDEELSNFYSPVEFKLGFPKIISHLIDTKHLTHQNLNDYSAMYGVKFILELTKQPEKLDAFYKQLVAEKVIVEKGDY